MAADRSTSDTREKNRECPVATDRNRKCGLTQGDCLEVLPTLEAGSVDLVLTDPPYAISRASGFTNGKLSKYKTHSIDFGEWDAQEIDLDATATEMFRCLRQGGGCIMFYDLWKIESLTSALTKAGFKQPRFVEWVKTNPVPINSKLNYLTNAREVAVSVVKGGKPTFNSEYDNGIYRFPIARENRVHPTQKPLALMEALVAKHTHSGDLVVDPFCGSGTTLVAAKRLGRRFIGCDISVEYVDHAKSRIEAETGVLI